MCASRSLCGHLLCSRTNGDQQMLLVLMTTGIYEVIDRKSTIDGLSEVGLRPDNLQGEVTAESITFAYPGSEDSVVMCSVCVCVGVCITTSRCIVKIMCLQARSSLQLWYLGVRPGV